ncbi:MAG: DMT family transporter [Rhodobacteraceae bacterium]|nr:DMT family transporter [Paracoccaceae bacterium]
MIGSMAGFAVEDAFLKATAATLPLAQVMVLFGLGGALVFALLTRLSGQPLYVPDVTSRPMLIRVGFEIVGRLFYVLAIALIPLSTATVILQATPLVVVLGAVVIFGETVGWRRWLAIFTGLAGVVIIVQPGSDGFSALSLLAILGMIGFAGRDLASRVAPATVGTLRLGLYGFLSIVLAGGLYAFWERLPFVTPDAATSLTMLGAVLFGVLGYACLMKAMRTGDVSAVTPFRYTRLLFGITLGVVIFGETLTPAMLTGSALIVLSGLFVLWRGRSD